MSRKNWGFVLAGVGLLLVVLAILADSIGLGGTPGFGFMQIAALVIGVILLIVGLYLAFAAQPAAAVPAAASTPAAPPRVEPIPAASAQKDDLTRLEGIGPKLQDVLYAAGFTTFAALAQAGPDDITRAMKASGVKVPFDASTWPEQASLAAQGNWTALETLQASLRGGRKHVEN